MLVYMTALYRFPYQYEGGFLKAEKSVGIINNFFTDIGPNLAKGFNPQEWVPVTPPPPVDTTIGESDVGWESVRKLCREIKIAKSSVYAHLSSQILKDAFIALSVQLKTHMFNLSLSTGVFPDDWKTATIVPLHKGGTIRRAR